MPSSNIAPALFDATVRSHLADPQGKWCLSHETNELLHAFIESSGVSYGFAKTAVMEACADHWLRCVHEVGHTFLRSNLACRQFTDTEVSERPNGERHEYHQARTVTGSVSRLVAEFIAPFGAAAEARAALEPLVRYRAFYRFLYTKLQQNPSLFEEYAPEFRSGWVDEGIADYLTPSEMREIDAEIQQRAEDEKRAAAVAREKRAAEEAAREKRAAAAAARKARKAKGGA